MTAYADLGDFAENDQIEAIGRTASGGALVGFIVDDDEKADRYIAKLAKRFPVVRVIDRMAGPVKGTILVRVRGAAN